MSRTMFTPMPREKERLIEEATATAEICGGEVEHAEDIIGPFIKMMPENPLVYDGAQQLQFVLGARWAVNAFPQVTIGAKHAAALAATRYPDDVLDEVRAPFSAWLIEVPPDLILMTDNDGRQTHVARILTGWDPVMKWSFIAYSAGSPPVALNRWGYTPSQLVDQDQPFGERGLLFPLNVSDLDERAVTIIGRLIIGVALEMAEGSHVASAPRGPVPPWKPRRRKRGAPNITPRTYVLKADIKVDVRPVLREFMLGKRGTAPAVQHVVKGHWKLQPYGPGNSQRKLIWVQPYWRGPEDAPIAVRSYAMKNR